MFLFLLLTVMFVVVIIVYLRLTLGFCLGISLVMVVSPLVNSPGVMGISGKERRGQVSVGLSAVGRVAVGVAGKVGEDGAGVDGRRRAGRELLVEDKPGGEDDFSQASLSRAGPNGEPPKVGHLPLFRESKSDLLGSVENSVKERSIFIF